MKIGEIINDAILYPLSDWRTFLFLGLIIVLGSLNTITGKFFSKTLIIVLFAILALIFTLVTLGYQLRILESTVKGNNILPALSRSKQLIFDGLRVFIVSVVYIIPLVVILVPLITVLAITSIGSGANMAGTGLFKYFGAVLVIAGLYLLIMYPIFFMALVNMANNERDIGAAFKFGDIKNVISNIGLGKFIIWYIITGLIYILILLIELGLPALFNTINIKPLGSLIAALLVSPFALIFLYRSVALIYLDGVYDDELDET
jgi:hypothetical protein